MKFLSSTKVISVVWVSCVVLTTALKIITIDTSLICCGLMEDLWPTEDPLKE